MRYCCAVLCHAVPCCVLFAVHFTCQVSFEVSYHRYYCCTYQVLNVESQKCSHSSARQRSAVRCRTVPCLALRCCAVPRCAFCRAYSSTRHHAIPGTDRCMYVCTRLFSLSSFDCHLSVLLCFENCTHTCDQNVTSPTSTNSTAQRNQLFVQSRSWHYHIAGCTKSWTSSAGFTFSCTAPCASVPGGVSRPRSGALVYTTKMKA